MRRLYGTRWFEFKPEYHLYYFTHPGLTRLLETVGLRRVYPERVRWIDDAGHQIRMVAQRQLSAPGGRREPRAGVERP